MLIFDCMSTPYFLNLPNAKHPKFWEHSTIIQEKNEKKNVFWPENKNTIKSQKLILKNVNKSDL